MGSRLMFSNVSSASTVCGRRPSSRTRAVLARGPIVAASVVGGAFVGGEFVGVFAAAGDAPPWSAVISGPAVAADVPLLGRGAALAVLGRLRAAIPLFSPRATP